MAISEREIIYPTTKDLTWRVTLCRFIVIAAFVAVPSIGIGPSLAMIFAAGELDNRASEKLRIHKK